MDDEYAFNCWVVQLLKEENKEAIGAFWLAKVCMSVYVCKCGSKKCRDFGVDICVYLIKRVSIIFLKDKLALKRKTLYVKPTY